jgi:hypothetical protein
LNKLADIIDSKSLAMVIGGHPRLVNPDAIASYIEAKFLIIDRNELPETASTDGFVQVNGSNRLWPCGSDDLDRAHRDAMVHLAAVEAIRDTRDKWAKEEAVETAKQVTINVPGNCVVEYGNTVTECFSSPGTFTYTPDPFKTLTIRTTR